MNWTRALWIGGAILLATMVFHLVALGVTGGAVTGAVSLRKPATFGESGGLAAWATAVILPRLDTKAWQRAVIGSAVLLFGFGETTIMAIEAWRGVPSHYNFSTPLDAALMRGGAAGLAGIFLAGVIVLLVATARTTGLARSVRLGVLAGGAALFTGALVGLVMVSNNSGVFQGSVGSGFANRTAAYLGPAAATVGPEYLMVRPATAGGDLVLPHAIGVHGLLLLAVPAVLLAGTGMAAARQLRVIATAVTGIVVAMILLLAHAFRQLPLNELSPVALLVLASCAVAVGWAYVGIGRAMREQRLVPTG